MYEKTIPSSLSNLKDESRYETTGSLTVDYPQICIRVNRKPQRTDLDEIINISNSAAEEYPNDKEKRTHAVVSELTSLCGSGQLGHSWIIIFYSNKENDYTCYGYHEKKGFVEGLVNDKPTRKFGFQLVKRISKEEIDNLENNIIPDLNQKSTEIAKLLNIYPGNGQVGVYTPVTNCTWFAGNVWNKTTHSNIVFMQPFDGKNHADDWGIDILYLMSEVSDPGVLAEYINNNHLEKE
ncbi:hypothetical protein [Pectobacterium carotovorum]|uniref:Uncharacterized protein n=1 Tax=Pectobacterium carotovorum TaxID=554 RepID=A0A419ASE5_PECCA|nr:hypothetical protein [Pectobacterium carotovorum]RJL48718.1 hypothetical protein D5071_17575 [Pectobacterium carotovorum]